MDGFKSIRGMHITVLKITLYAYQFECVTCTCEGGRKIKLVSRIISIFLLLFMSSLQASVVQ